MPNARPKIDDQFWFDYSAKIVEKASDGPDAAAAKIQSLAVWLWGVYTVGSAIGFTLANKQLPFWSTLLIALGSVSIIIVYWAAVWVQIPVVTKFDPRSPEDILQVYSTAVHTKQVRLKLAFGLSGAAAVLISLALITASVSKAGVNLLNDFQAAISTNTVPPHIVISAKLATAKTVSVFVSASSELPADATATTLIPFKDGIIQTALPLSSNQRSRPLFVTLRWNTSNGLSVAMTRLASEE